MQESEEGEAPTAPAEHAMVMANIWEAVATADVPLVERILDQDPGQATALRLMAGVRRTPLAAAVRAHAATAERDRSLAAIIARLWSGATAAGGPGLDWFRAELQEVTFHPSPLNRAAARRRELDRILAGQGGYGVADSAEQE